LLLFDINKLLDGVVGVRGSNWCGCNKLADDEGIKILLVGVSLVVDNNLGPTVVVFIVVVLLIKFHAFIGVTSVVDCCFIFDEEFDVNETVGVVVNNNGMVVVDEFVFRPCIFNKLLDVLPLHIVVNDLIVEVDD